MQSGQVYSDASVVKSVPKNVSTHLKHYISLLIFEYINILKAFTEKYRTKPLERDAVYYILITKYHATQCQWRQNKQWVSILRLDVGSVPQLGEYLRVSVRLLQF